MSQVTVTLVAGQQRRGPVSGNPTLWHHTGYSLIRGSPVPLPPVLLPNHGPLTPSQLRPQRSSRVSPDFSLATLVNHSGYDSQSCDQRLDLNTTLSSSQVFQVTEVTTPSNRTCHACITTVFSFPLPYTCLSLPRPMSLCLPIPTPPLPRELLITFQISLCKTLPPGSPLLLCVPPTHL